MFQGIPSYDDVPTRDLAENRWDRAGRGACPAMTTAAEEGEVHVGEPQPGVRRLCVAAATVPAGLLASACRSADVGRLCVTVNSRDGTEMAFAPPGVHEVAVVTRLIAALLRLVTRKPAAPRPTLLAFHVGITKIEGEGFGGEAALRTRALLLNPAIRAAAAVGRRQLAVIMSDGLYADLRAEGLPSQDWLHIPAASAWMRWCEGAPHPQADGSAYP
jgi:hypothetical protein